MSRKLVWVLTLAAAGLAAAAASAQQFRNYGDTYAAAPDYYEGGPGGGYGGGYQGGYGGGRYFGGPGYGPYDAPPPRRFREPMQGYNEQAPAGPEADRPYEQPPRFRPPRRDYDERDYGYGYDQGPAPDYNDPNGGRGPGQKASDEDLGESANRRTVTEVENTTHQPPGTIVINTAERHLYYTQPNGQALQYGIGVGREGFAWKGTAAVKRKAEWPDWIPPSDMLKRRPDLPTRMAGGMENPLGARALYLFKGEKDTMFRIHGTNEPDTIGKAVSSGCIRMMNADVIDLYSRVPVGTKVVVL